MKQYTPEKLVAVSRYKVLFPTLSPEIQRDVYSLSFGGRLPEKRRQSDGVIPVIFLNTWEKCADETKPTVSPISEMLRSLSFSSSFAFSQRRWL